jgi:hypothetical protein
VGVVSLINFFFFWSSRVLIAARVRWLLFPANISFVGHKSITAWKIIQSLAQKARKLNLFIEGASHVDDIFGHPRANICVAGVSSKNIHPEFFTMLGWIESKRQPRSMTVQFLVTF